MSPPLSLVGWLALLLAYGLAQMVASLAQVRGERLARFRHVSAAVVLAVVLYALAVSRGAL